mgnify:CR=1 FL=1
MSAPAFFFYAFGAAAVLSALAMVLNVRNTVAAAMSLVITMISLAVVYVVLDAHLVALDAATGLLSGTLSFASAGTYPVRVTVSDAVASTSQTFTWTVASGSSSASPIVGG